MKLCTLGQPLQSSSPPVKKVEPRFSSKTSKEDLSKHQDDFHNPKDCNDGLSDLHSKMMILVVSTSKRLRALAPAPAVMESPREAMSPMSWGLSWWTLRWVGGCRSCHNEEDCSDDDGAGVLVCLCGDQSDQKNQEITPLLPCMGDMDYIMKMIMMTLCKNDTLEITLWKW